ncbi:MAG: hypothetical protein WB783_07635 [Arenicellales bacterium]
MNTNTAIPTKEMKDHNTTEEIFVFDNAVSKNYQNAIKARIQENNFPWFYVPNVSRRTEGENRLATDTMGFGHCFYEQGKGSISFVTDFLTPLLYECCAKIDATPEMVYFARVIMTVANGSTHRNLFHTDMDTAHLVCLYYVNDASGPTVILNKTHMDIGRDEVNARDQSENIACEVNPRQGRVVLFNGKYFHASTNPESGRRCIINYDVGPWQ